MASDLMLPSGLAPSNLHLSGNGSARFVESDMFDIAKRLTEIDRSLHVFEIVEGDQHVYAVMEHCADGEERLVFKAEVLDARILDKVRYLFSVPFEHRFAEAEAEEARANAQFQEDQLDELYERVGRPMWTELDACGFIDRSTSYPKTGVTRGKGSLARV